MEFLEHLQQRLRQWRLRHATRINIGAGICHACYFAFVFAQGHGYYTYAAGILCLHAVVNVLLNEDVE